MSLDALGIMQLFTVLGENSALEKLWSVFPKGKSISGNVEEMRLDACTKDIK